MAEVKVTPSDYVAAQKQQDPDLGIEAPAATVEEVRTDFNHNDDGGDHKGDEKEEDDDQKDDPSNVEVAKKKRKKRSKRKGGKAQASSHVRRPSLYSNSYQNKPTGFEENYADPPMTPDEHMDEQRLYDP